MTRDDKQTDHYKDAAGTADITMPKALKGVGQRDVTASRAMVARALQVGAVTVVYQPVIDARCLPQIAFYEALIRLRSPSGGLLAPGQFLPAIQGTPLASAIDRVALAKTLAQLRAMPDTRISVNICPMTLDDPAWLSTLSMAANETPDLPYRLIVEMTEDEGFLAHPRCASFLASLRSLGVSVALDDFGAGATGFSHFREHRFDIVKIDGSYGDQLATNPDAQALVRAMLGLARHFEMLSVIEYIDNPEDAACAVRLGVDCMQGYLFGRPSEDMDGRSGTDGTAIG
ncbi:EAL domain-containing protein [Oceanibium sediminis]|uniref:EAL domain-containing protein n=1 Tax=Oceanibium sediminis TaxID=2026339 RepID=UPI0013009D78|nr:EAL domain-containing protein [Oceanibium sediminis]